VISLATTAAIRAQTGSGEIKITKPADSVEVNAGSGSVSLSGITADLRVHTSSGEVTVEGNPQANTYWEIHTSSGTVTLRVPPNANLRLYARTSSGDIDTQIPITMEGTTGKHELRARIGDGKARVEIETSREDSSTDYSPPSGTTLFYGFRAKMTRRCELSISLPAVALLRPLLPFAQNPTSKPTASKSAPSSDAKRDAVPSQSCKKLAPRETAPRWYAT
jgi:hypothetical protein